MYDTYNYPSPLGTIAIASDGEALTELHFAGSMTHFDTAFTTPHQRLSAPSDPKPAYKEAQSLSALEQTKMWLDIYFSGDEPCFTPPLRLQGTAFSMAVWNILRTIPYGQTMTYGEIAGIIAKQKGMAKMSAQAIGGAVGRNPIALIVPCHRVVGANGKLTGYAAGLDRKARLLELEGII